MSLDLPTGRTVRLPLVWREHALYVGPFGKVGYIHAYETGPWKGQFGWWAVKAFDPPLNWTPTYGGDSSDRSAAMCAVEDVVVKALGRREAGMSEQEDARRAALLRLLEDLEAGRTSEWNVVVGGVSQGLWNEGFTAQAAAFRWTLTPAGLAAARAAKGEAT